MSGTFYEERADRFFQDTVGVDMQLLRGCFGGMSPLG